MKGYQWTLMNFIISRSDLFELRHAGWSMNTIDFDDFDCLDLSEVQHGAQIDLTAENEELSITTIDLNAFELLDLSELPPAMYKNLIAEMNDYH